MIRFLIVALFASSLAACGPGVDTNNPEYQIGYQDGCDSGISYDPQFSGRVNRNEDLWKASEFYRAGWKSGFNHCRPPSLPGGAGDIPGSDRR